MARKARGKRFIPLHLEEAELAGGQCRKLRGQSREHLTDAQQPLRAVAVTDPQISEAEIKALHDGYQHVNKGDILYRIDPAPFEAALARLGPYPR